MIWPNEYVEKELKMKWLKRDGKKSKFRWISQITLFPMEEIVNPA